MEINVEEEMQKWETEEGVSYLREIGMKPGQTVLDFGARNGHYAIPAAIVVENHGLVYAVDKEQQPLDELERKATLLGITNIKTIKNSGEVTLNFARNTINVVLLYDILHYFASGERKALYSEVYRVLKYPGLLSVYPKHVIEDDPLGEFQRLHLEDVKQEIENSCFLFENKCCVNLSHNCNLNSGCVLNFKKTN